MARHFDCVEVVDSSLVDHAFVSIKLQAMLARLNEASTHCERITELAAEVMNYLDERAGFDWSRAIEIDEQQTLCVSYANDSQHVVMLVQRGPLAISKMLSTVRWNRGN